MIRKFLFNVFQALELCPVFKMFFDGRNGKRGALSLMKTLIVCHGAPTFFKGGLPWEVAISFFRDEVKLCG